MDERPMFYGAKSEIFRRAKMLRNNETKAEKELWKKLSKNQLNGFRFKRQHPIDIYIVDFYCHAAKLVIEIDEAYHENPMQKEKDNQRSDQLANLGQPLSGFRKKKSSKKWKR